MRRWWRALTTVLAGVLVAAGLPLLAQPAAANPWTPGDAWDLGSTNAAVDGLPFNGQGHLLPSHDHSGYQRFYAFVDAGGSLEVRMLAVPGNAIAAGGVATIRVTSPQGQVFYAEQAFGQSGLTHGLEAVREVILGVDEPLTSDVAGVWTVDMFNEFGTAASSSNDASILRWDIVPRDADGTVYRGRVWTHNYRRAHYLIHLNPYAGDSGTFLGDGPGQEHGRWVWDQSAWIWSADGLLVRVDNMGYNGNESSLWATSNGLVDAECQPVRRSRSMGGPWPGTSFAEAQNCDLPLYRVFTEHPDVSMPAFTQYPDGSTQRINFPLTMPSIEEITYTQVGRGSVFDGQINVTLSGQPTTVRVEIDTDGDGNFDGAGDRVLFEEWTLQPGTTDLAWDGLDGNGLPVPLDRSVGVRVTMLSSFETHIVANDVERRLGGIRLTALNGPLAASEDTRYLVNWDDSDPSFFDADGGLLCWGNTLNPVPCRDTDLFPESIVGIRVDSREGVHAWGGIPTETLANSAQSWGDGKDIVTWQVADMSEEAVTVIISETPFEADLEIEIEITGEQLVPVCPPAGEVQLPVDVQLLVTVTNHGLDDATDVMVTLPEGTVLAEEQDHLTASGNLVLVGDLEVDGYVTFYIISELSEDSGWDVTVTVEGAEYDPNPGNNTSTSTGTIPSDTCPYPGLGGGQDIIPEPIPDAGDTDGPGDENLGGGQDLPAGPTVPAGPTSPEAERADGPAGPEANAPTSPSAPVRTPARLPLTGASGIWIAGAGLAVVGGILLALNTRKSKAAATASNE